MSYPKKPDYLLDRFLIDSDLKGSSSGRFWPGSDLHNPIPLSLEIPQQFLELIPALTKIEGIVNNAMHSFDGVLSVECKRKLADLLNEVSHQLSHPDDIRHFNIKSDALREGYSPQMLSELNKLNENLSIVVGNISTWFGKTTEGKATAFAATRSPELDNVIDMLAQSSASSVEMLIFGLHKRLKLAEVPKYRASNLAFMCGEGNSHPKHIAYFLPEDEGYKYSPIKKTHYFSNTHLSLVEGVSIPLLERHTNLPYEISHLKVMACLGVLAHEYGHFIRLDETDFRVASKASRWMSVTLQELAADVFGFLILAESWGYTQGFQLKDVVTYHLGEIFRYINRGFNLFPDSDGMLIQLNYLLSQGALVYNAKDLKFELSDPGMFLASFRSLARLLTETLLSNRTEGMEFLMVNYGTQSEFTQMTMDFYKHLGKEFPKSVEYKQAYLS